jgi:hypothetical protein
MCVSYVCGGAAGLPRLHHVRILPHTDAAVYLASSYYDIRICVRILLHTHTAVYLASSYYDIRICVRILHTAAGTHPDLEEVLDANLQCMCREILFDPSFSGQVSACSSYSSYHTIYLYICRHTELLVNYFFFAKSFSVSI